MVDKRVWLHTDRSMPLQSLEQMHVDVELFVSHHTIISAAPAMKVKVLTMLPVEMGITICNSSWSWTVANAGHHGRSWSWSHESGRWRRSHRCILCDCCWWWRGFYYQEWRWGNHGHWCRCRCWCWCWCWGWCWCWWRQHRSFPWFALRRLPFTQGRWSSRAHHVRCEQVTQQTLIQVRRYILMQT